MSTYQDLLNSHNTGNDFHDDFKLTKYKLYLCPTNSELKSIYTYKLRNVTPVISHNSDSGFDLFTPDEVCIEEGSTHVLDLGVKAKMVKLINERTGTRPSENEMDDPAYFGDRWADQQVVYDEIPVAYQMVSRSSTGKNTPLMLANGSGLIDSSYRGNIKAIFNCLVKKDNHFQDTWGESFKIEKHRRLVQLVSPDLSPFIVELVESLDSTTRGNNGLGSTGI